MVLSGNPTRLRYGSAMLNVLRHVWRHILNAEVPLRGMGASSIGKWYPGTAVAAPFTDRARLLVSRGMYSAA
jgi:hypothetical protein